MTENNANDAARRAEETLAAALELNRETERLLGPAAFIITGPVAAAADQAAAALRDEFPEEEDDG